MQDRREEPATKKKHKPTNRDKRRADAYRARKGDTEGMDAIQAELSKILYPGFASVANAV